MTSTIVFIDSRVADYQTLVAGLAVGTEWFLLNAEEDGMEQMQRTLANHSNLDALHVISHGSQGTLYIGSTVLNADNLASYESQLRAIGASLTDTGDILLYGCNVGAGEAGRPFIEALATVTGADLVASTNTTGNAKLAGDWLLEIMTGPIETQVFSEPNVTGLLDTLQGSYGDDALYGGPGGDHLSGYAGNDYLYGGEGSDWLDGGTGNDVIDGGSGDDFLDIQSSANDPSSNDVLIGGADNDHIFISIGQQTGQVDNQIDAGSGDDTIHFNFGSGISTTLQYAAMLRLGAGIDLVFITANAGSGELSPGISIADFGVGWDGDILDLGYLGESISLSSLDWRSGYNAFTDMREEHDFLRLVQQGDNTLLQWDPDGSQGVAYNWKTMTTLENLNANALTSFNIFSRSLWLFGTSSDDYIFGNDEDEVLEGGGGYDVISGGAGRDRFIISNEPNSTSVVTDFQSGPLGDGIDLRFLLSYSANYGGYSEITDPFISGYLRLEEYSGGTLIQWNPAGKGSENWRTVVDLQNIAASDLIPQNIVGIPILGDSGDNYLSGDIWSDLIIAGAGYDVLDGGGDSDYMEGGIGGDTYYVDNAGDLVIEENNNPSGPDLNLDLGSTVDTVIASINYALTNYLEILELTGGDGNLSGTGNSLDNLLTGNEGNNTLTGGGGNDVIDGENGIDTVVFSGARTHYALSEIVSQLTVVAFNGADGTDTLSNIERLQFADKKVALDLDGNAGKVAKILATVFGAAEVSNEVYAGIGLSLIDGEMKYEDLTDLAISVTPAKTPEAVVTLLWSNVMGSPPSTADAQPFIDMLNGGMTYGQLGVLAADYAALIGVVDLAALALTGLEYV